MSTKELGRAKYHAFRIGSITNVIAVGTTPNWNDKVDIEQLPFRIFPPWYALYFITPSITLPATRPFVYQEAIIYPQDEKTIHMEDADGSHDVPITTLGPINADQLPPGKAEPIYCVFSRLGDKQMLIAECDSPLPRIYGRVFGPATLAACEKFVKDGGAPRT